MPFTIFLISTLVITIGMLLEVKFNDAKITLKIANKLF